jgi:drug/metabolite transporter (DMT)-like permease
VLIHASVSRVSTYAYVNPVVAVILGGLLLNETVDVTMMVGAAVIIVSVWLVIRTEARKPSLRQGAVEAEPVA